MNIAILTSGMRTGAYTPFLAQAISGQIQNFAGNIVNYIDIAERDIPFMIERDGIWNDAPPQVAILGKELHRADALILVSPEYNGGFSPVIKNALDFFPKKTYANKAIGVATASAGSFAGIRAAMQLQQQVLALKAFPHPHMLTIGNIAKHFSESGTIINSDIINTITAYLKEFIWFAEAITDKRNASM